MRTTANAKVISFLVVWIALIALFALGVVLGVHAFLAGVGHYAPWEQIWSG